MSAEARLIQGYLNQGSSSAYPAVNMKNVFIPSQINPLTLSSWVTPLLTFSPRNFLIVDYHDSSNY